MHHVPGFEPWPSRRLAAITCGEGAGFGKPLLVTIALCPGGNTSWNHIRFIVRQLGVTLRAIFVERVCKLIFFLKGEQMVKRLENF